VTVQPGESAAEAEPADPPGDDHPRGTLLVAGIFLVALVGLWTLMYVMMLSRS
jgi:hypothetical protein